MQRKKETNDDKSMPVNRADKDVNTKLLSIKGTRARVQMPGQEKATGPRGLGTNKEGVPQRLQ
jgi:hypothetical protein